MESFWRGHVKHVEYRGLIYGFTETAEKKKVNVILKPLDFRVVIATLCCKYCQTSSCFPLKTRGHYQ